MGFTAIEPYSTCDNKWGVQCINGVTTNCWQCGEEKDEAMDSLKNLFNDVMTAQYINGCSSVKLTVRENHKPIRIIRSGIATIVFWEDGTKTIVKRSPDTEDDPYAAFCIALAKKIYGSNSAVKRIIERKTTIQNIIKKEI